MFEKEFADGTIIGFTEGKFDNWCVFAQRPNAQRYKPLDIDYFTQVKDYAERFGTDRVYEDFVSIYSRTKNEVEDGVIKHIEQISESYGDEKIEISILFSILYYAMIAEQNRVYKKDEDGDAYPTKVGKNLKRLGVHQMLYLEFTPEEAANYTKGMKWYEIKQECENCGFWEEVSVETEMTEINTNAVEQHQEALKLYDLNNLVNEHLASSGLAPIKSKTISEWLESQEYLCREMRDNGGYKRIPTEKGLQAGIRQIEMTSAEGNTYVGVVYSQTTVRLLIDNIQELVKLERDKETAKRARIENDHTPWSEQDIQRACEMYRNGISVHIIAKEFKRTRGAVTAQLIRNGLIERERWTEIVLPRSDYEDTTT